MAIKKKLLIIIQSMDIQGGPKKEAVDYYSVNGYTLYRVALKRKLFIIIAITLSTASQLS